MEAQQPATQTSAKSDFSDIRDRKRLGKRILKSVQPQLEAALQLESDINHRSFESLKQELEGMIEAALELRLNTQATNPPSGGEDVFMIDSAVPEITVGGADAIEDAAAGEAPQEDTEMPDAEDQPVADSGNIEVKTSESENDTKLDGVPDAVASFKTQEPAAEKSEAASMNNVQSLDTPPAINGFDTAPRPQQSGPPTPPQSNGSLGKQPTDTLTEGGIIWYLKDFEPEGTSAVQERWPGRDAVRSLSEELTELDEDDIKGLEVEVSHEESITASPANADSAAEVASNASPTKKSAKTKKRKATYASRRR
jgi:NuA3 HAT complex component NTO1